MIEAMEDIDEGVKVGGKALKVLDLLTIKQSLQIREKDYR